MNFKFGDEPGNLDFSVGGDDGIAHPQAPAPQPKPVAAQPSRIPGPPPRLPKAPVARPLTPPVAQPQPRYEEPVADSSVDAWADVDETPRSQPASPVRPQRSLDEVVDTQENVRNSRALPSEEDDQDYIDNYDELEEEPYEEAPRQRPRQNTRQNRPAPRPRDEDVAPRGKGKGKLSGVTKASKKGPKGPSNWSGGRKKVLIARIVIFTILGLLVFAGIRSFLPQASNLTAADQQTLIGNVRQELGITDFPATTGESVALGFSEVYLSYGVNSREQREAQLLRYVPQDILDNIDVRFASEADLAAADATPVTPDPDAEGAGEGDDIEPDVQVVTGGPYVMGRTMVAGGENAVYTTATEVNNGSWIYMQVPLYYDAETTSVSVSGSPSFTDGPKAGPVPTGLLAQSWPEDSTVEDAIEADITNYFRAWAASDTASIDRFVLKRDGQVAASENAIRGLNGALRLIRVDDIAVELKERPEEGAAQEAIDDFRQREARVTVVWLEPSSNLVYTQTYAMKIAYTNENWFIEDIENQGVTLGQSRERL